MPDRFKYIIFNLHTILCGGVLVPSLQMRKLRPQRGKWFKTVAKHRLTGGSLVQLVLSGPVPVLDLRVEKAQAPDHYHGMGQVLLLAGPQLPHL